MLTVTDDLGGRIRWPTPAFFVLPCIPWLACIHGVAWEGSSRYYRSNVLALRVPLRCQLNAKTLGVLVGGWIYTYRLCVALFLRVSIHSVWTVVECCRDILYVDETGRNWYPDFSHKREGGFRVNVARQRAVVVGRRYA